MISLRVMKSTSPLCDDGPYAGEPYAGERYIHIGFCGLGLWYIVLYRQGHRGGPSSPLPGIGNVVGPSSVETVTYGEGRALDRVPHFRTGIPI